MNFQRIMPPRSELDRRERNLTSIGERSIIPVTDAITSLPRSNQIEGTNSRIPIPIGRTTRGMGHLEATVSSLAKQKPMRHFIPTAERRHMFIPSGPSGSSKSCHRSMYTNQPQRMSRSQVRESVNYNMRGRSAEELVPEKVTNDSFKTHTHHWRSKSSPGENPAVEECHRTYMKDFVHGAFKQYEYSDLDPVMLTEDQNVNDLDARIALLHRKNEEKKIKVLDLEQKLKAQDLRYKKEKRTKMKKLSKLQHEIDEVRIKNDTVKQKKDTILATLKYGEEVKLRKQTVLEKWRVHNKDVRESYDKQELKLYELIEKKTQKALKSLIEMREDIANLKDNNNNLQSDPSPQL